MWTWAPMTATRWRSLSGTVRTTAGSGHWSPTPRTSGSSGSRRGTAPDDAGAQGRYSGEGELTFSARGGRNSALAESGKRLRPVELTSVDALLQGNRADYIKMDVEGVERETLLGCRETIARWKPQLSVAAYHRNGDLWELPLLVRELGPDYRLYLRRHKYVPAWEIILYAI